MDHLRKECGDIGCDLAPQRLGRASPNAFRSDEHASTSLSPAKAISSSTASTVSLLNPPSGNRTARLVAATGSLSCMRPW